MMVRHIRLDHRQFYLFEGLGINSHVRTGSWNPMEVSIDLRDKKGIREQDENLDILFQRIKLLFVRFHLIWKFQVKWIFFAYARIMDGLPIQSNSRSRFICGKRKRSDTSFVAHSHGLRLLTVRLTGNAMLFRQKLIHKNDGCLHRLVW